ncbi:MAG TPA: ATP-dependent zinc metalloprotease FtsH [Phycisphaerae bacterium]|jgi:cell division protease FtsH
MPDNRDEQKESENPTPPGKPSGSGGDGNMRFSRSMLAWILLLATAILLIVVLHGDKGPDVKTWSEFKSFIENGTFKTVSVKDEGSDYLLIGTPAPGFESSYPNKVTTRVPLSALDGQGWNALTDLLKSRGRLEFQPSSNIFFNLILPMLPYVLIFVLIWFFFLRQIRSAGGGIGMLGNFGRSRHRLLSKEHTNITFNDVAGIEEAKEELSEIVEFLKNPKRFQKLGGRIPRGVLLIGDPGVGKTLLAKAIAGEADVPFFSISGSDFVEMFVGVGASRVRDLFKTAKESSPCIIFLDEIDAVGRRRGNGMASGGHDEREQTLNAILVEMDGFDTNDQVIVIAATNRADVLDPALTRPGRFDRQVNVPLPDIKGRYEILKVHSRKVKLGASVDMMRLARQTPGFSGADLAAIINESALIATMGNKEAIDMSDLEEARDKLRFGKARKSRVIDEKDKIATAYHEAGHAVIQYLERENADPIHKVTIIPRGRYGGATMTLPEKDRTSTSRKWSIAFIKMGVAGRIAEEMFTGDINTGAGGDIRQVTGLARAMVRDWGMNPRVGFVFYGEDESRMNPFGMGSREYSEETARIIDEEVKKLIDSLEAETREMLLAHKDRIEALAQALMRYETLDGSDVERVMKGENLTKPTVTDLLASEQQRRTEARKEEEKRNAKPEDPTLGPIPQPG